METNQLENVAPNLGVQIITLLQGKIQGCVQKSIYDQVYYSFEGIPFGKPPLGDLRFKAPLPAEPWEGIRNCSSCADKPIQKNREKGCLEGSEDCLYLNVYTKKLSTKTPLPVMVWVYGGAYKTGGATRERWGPDYLMREDIVLVTFNYRLCALGFLSLKDEKLDIPGNAGLKDQVLALKWVKNNIKEFNGDPNNVTLFGESAGGSSVHFLAITEQTRGLFQKFVPMSGVALSDWTIAQDNDMAYRLAKYNGYTGENIDENVLAFLNELHPSKLVMHEILKTDERRQSQMFPFVPIVEPYITKHCIISQQPLELLRNAWTNKLPMMIGGTSFEGLVMYPHYKNNPRIMNITEKEREYFLPREVLCRNTEEENKILAEKLIKIHFGEKQPSEETFHEFLDLYSYKLFWDGIQRTILSRLKYSTAPTYLYRFDFFSADFNAHHKKFCGDDPIVGVAHADDLSYLFFAQNSWKLEKEAIEYKTIQRMVGIWTSFAKSSDPNCAELHPIVWNRLENSNPYCCVNISHVVEVKELPEKIKLDVWKDLYKTEDLC